MTELRKVYGFNCIDLWRPSNSSIFQARFAAEESP